MFRLIAFILAVSGLCLGSSARADDAEDKAVAFVEKLNGTVARDVKVPGNPVVRVNLTNKEVTDTGLKELAALKNLTTLDLEDCRQVTGVGLKELAALKNLPTLRLNGPEVTDAGVKELTALKNLTTLDMGNCSQVTDAGVKDRKSVV